MIGKGMKDKKYNKAGEWNHVRIVCKDNNVEHIDQRGHVATQKRHTQSKSASSSLMISTASRISSLWRAPVITILPLPKIRQTTLG